MSATDIKLMIVASEEGNKILRNKFGIEASDDLEVVTRIEGEVVIAQLKAASHSDSLVMIEQEIVNGFARKFTGRSLVMERHHV